MLELAPYDAKPLCFGHHWTVKDERQLAAVVAALLLGHHLHAEMIMQGGALAGAPRPSAVEKAIEFVESGDASEAKRYHRDGLLFQMISWIAAKTASSGATLIRAPHIRAADKGLDGLLIERGEGEAPLWRAVVCEDKATENPRSTVREKVWPEFEEFESGRRDSEINADACALAATLPSIEDRLRLLDDIQYFPLHYRVCVTVEAEAPSDSLFRGYDEVVAGDDCDRRRAEIMPLNPPLRPWMDHFCTIVSDELRRTLQGTTTGVVEHEQGAGDETGPAGEVE